MDSQSVKKLVVKVSTARSTKRLGQIPSDFSTLKTRCEQIEPKLKTQDFCITYADSTGDAINVSDDEDLQEAYDVAQSELKGQLKLSIQARVGELDLDQSQITERQSSRMDTSVFDAPQTDRSNFIKAEPMQMANKDVPVDQKQEQEEEYQIDSKTIKAELDEMINSSKKEDSENECMSSDSDDDEFKGKKRNNPKKLAKDSNKLKKGKQGMPRKVFKKMIKRELEKQQAEIFQKLYNCEEIGQGQKLQDDDQISSASSEQQAKHMHVECDGCGVSPIVGPRYKCSVRKNFDFCSKCEERRDHPYAFLKINNPDQAPTAIFAVIDENQHPEAKTDGDVNNAGAQMFGAHGPPHHWGRGGPRHHNHGPHHGNRHGWGRGGKPGKNCPFMAGKKDHVPFGGQGVRADGSTQSTNSTANTQPQSARAGAQSEPVFDQAAFESDLQNTMESAFKAYSGDQNLQNKMKGLKQHMEALFKNCGGANAGNGWGQNTGNGGPNWRNCGQNWGNGGPHQNKPWRVNRGQLVSVPTDALVCHAGKSTLARIEMRNNTHWAYKPGCVLRSEFTGIAADSLEDVYLPIDTYVPEMSNFFLNIPLSVKDNAVLTYETEHNADFYVCGPRGNAFGEKITIKFKIVKQIDQDELYRVAVKIFDDLSVTKEDQSSLQAISSNEEGLFELVVEAVKEANCDEKLALQIVSKKRYAEEDDLYS